jgi:hypothetical protein
MKIQKINIKLVGIKPIIFNQFVSIKEEPPVEKKIPLVDGKVAISGDRILAFLIDNKPERPAGCVKAFTNSKQYKAVLPKVKAYIGFQPVISVLCEGKEINFENFDKTPQVKVRKDKVCGGPVPMIVERPIIENWSMEFIINLIENPEITFEKLQSWFERGGIEVGLGCSRPVYGQFIVEKFEKV